MWKEAVVIVIFIAMLFCTLSYGAKLKYDCSIKAMEIKYSSSEIQTICKF